MRIYAKNFAFWKLKNVFFLIFRKFSSFFALFGQIGKSLNLLDVLANFRPPERATLGETMEYVQQLRILLKNHVFKMRISQNE